MVVGAGGRAGFDPFGALPAASSAAAVPAGRGECVRRERRVEHQEAERRAYQGQAEELTRQLGRLESRLRGTTETMRAMEADKLVLCEEVLQRQLALLEARQQARTGGRRADPAVSERLGAAERQLHAMAAEKAAAETAAAEGEQLVARCKRSLEQAERSAAEAARQHSEQLAGLNAQADSLRSELVAARESERATRQCAEEWAAEHSLTVGSFEQDLAGLRETAAAELAGLRADLAAAEATVAEQSAQRAALEAELSRLSEGAAADRAGLERGLSEARAALEAEHERELAGLRAELEAMRAREESLESLQRKQQHADEIVDLRAELDAAEARSATVEQHAKAAAAEHAAAVAGLQAELAAARERADASDEQAGQLEGLQAEVTMLRAREESLESLQRKQQHADELVRLHTELAAAEATAAEQSAQRAALEAELSRLSEGAAADRAGLERGLSEARAALEAEHERELAGLRAELEAAESEQPQEGRLVEACDEIARLRGELRGVEQKAEAAVVFIVEAELAKAAAAAERDRNEQLCRLETQLTSERAQAAAAQAQHEAVITALESRLRVVESSRRSPSAQPGTVQHSEPSPVVVNRLHKTEQALEKEREVNTGSLGV